MQKADTKNYIGANNRTREEIAKKETVLSKAVISAAKQLDLANKDLSEIIGISEASISRMAKGKYVLGYNSKSFQLAAILVRLFRSLDTITGGDMRVAKAWLRNNNSALNNQPLQMIKTVSGLVNALAYLDSRRAPL